MAKTRFFRCKKCGNFITFIGEKTACTPKCCGEEMAELTANTTDAAKEKHVPDVTIDGDKVTVQVGSTAHPMQEEHHIQFICLETERGVSFRYLKPGEEPKAEFLLNGEKAVAVYEYCNLHGLWVKEI
ncbi:MAG: desulfoferrodoxin Dfx [Lachnospiraceae bacterium]|nr:desulfoferrodoxin Dfx [Lachnospiraceae bacterium]